MSNIGRRVAAALDTDEDEFAERAASEAPELKAELEVGTFDNPQAIVGLEYEFYGVDDATGVLRRVPAPLLELIDFEKELGLHNAELTTSPQPFGPHGLAAVHNEVQSAVRTAHAASTRSEHIRLVSDGLWTVPPVGETATEYLGASVERDGVVLSPNLSDSVRYQTMTNSTTYDQRRAIDAPNASFEAPTVLPSSLTATIQPHYQVPVAADLLDYFGYALRVAGPLVALAVNSPLFPPSLYDDDATVEDVLATGWRENRVHVFESVMNDPDRPDKVRFPRDLDSTGEAVDRLVADPPVAPMTLDPGDRFDDRFAHIRHKHGSYWRWVRPVFEGATESSANARIEFRPLPAQPTVRDSVALLAAFAGATKGLIHHDHPVASLSWERARENFYAAVRGGLDADLAWITADGSETTDTDEVYADLFDHVQTGLEVRGFDADAAESYLRPLRERVARRTTPASWKRDRLREHAADGADLDAAVLSAKRDYVDCQRDTLVEGGFSDWQGF